MIEKNLLFGTLGFLVGLLVGLACLTPTFAGQLQESEREVQSEARLEGPASASLALGALVGEQLDPGL